MDVSKSGRRLSLSAVEECRKNSPPSSQRCHTCYICHWVEHGVLTILPLMLQARHNSGLRNMALHPILLLAGALVAWLCLSAVEALEKVTIPMQHASRLTQQPFSLSETPVLTPSISVVEPLGKGKLGPLPLANDNKHDSASLSNSSIMAGDRANSKAGPEPTSGAVQSAGFEPLTSRTVNPQGTKRAAREGVAMGIVPFQIAETDGPSRLNRMTQPKRAASIMQGGDAPESKRSLLMFDTSSDLDEHFAVEDCAGKPIGSVPDPTDPTCYFICLGVDNRGIRKCCQVPGSCYVPPTDPLDFSYCSECSSDPTNRQSPPPTGPLYALRPCLGPSLCMCVKDGTCRSF
jgi:hypothetical protein